MKSALSRIVCLLALPTLACSAGKEAMMGLPSPTTPTAEALARRAYVVSKESDELTVIDLGSQEIIGRVATKGVSNHMAELSADFGKAYVTSSETNELVVVDTRSLSVVKRVPIGKHPAHLTLTPDGNLLAVMAEDDNAVVFFDTKKDEVVKALPGFYTPHFMRFDHAGKVGFVANIGASHLTRVDMAKMEILDHLTLEGVAGPPNPVLVEEGGFADAQIDKSGVLYAAHHASGRVLVYDTLKQQKLPELFAGRGPWVVFADHHFDALPLHHLVPNFSDRSVAMIDGTKGAVTRNYLGDEEAYGVNYSSRTPNKAFVMNRIRQDVAVLDTTSGEITARIPVGGNTETAATTADGRFIVATVSSAGKVVLIDPETNAIAKTFEGVGVYPWSVTIPNGQNYCH